MTSQRALRPLGDPQITYSLRNAHGVDSLGFVELRVQCEDLFGVHISDEEFVPENFRSVAEVAALVRRLRAE
jgi:acyl carrier protein